ncbi:MAG: hypothetical protein ABIF84_01225 [Patescibacteria group bacterium]
MLNPSQIKKLRGIIDPLIKQRYLKYFQLPQDIRQIMFAVETADKIWGISQKNKLNDDQVWWASHTTGMILLGEINIVDFVKTLMEKCQLNEQTSRQLARDINQVIFLPVKESLKTIHQVPEWPREQETNQTTVAPTETGPRLEGNVVNLKEP